jgi:hypothetical protein
MLAPPAHLAVALPDLEAGDLAEPEHLFESDLANHLFEGAPDLTRVRIYLNPLCRWRRNRCYQRHWHCRQSGGDRFANVTASQKGGQFAPP